MRNKYRMFRRGTVYWIQDNDTGRQETLRTKDPQEAKRLFAARNEAHRQPIINMQIARAYLMVGNPEAPSRTWQNVIEAIIKQKPVYSFHFHKIFLRSHAAKSGARTLDTILVHPREVFRVAIVAAAAAIVVMHNHPSGEPEPSEADIRVTRDLIRAGQLLKIDLCDHVIMGHGKHVSLRSLGYFACIGLCRLRQAFLLNAKGIACFLYA
jgi:hypothetical protein